MSGILSDVTTERWMERERQLAEDVGNLAIQSKSIEIENQNNLVVRDILPSQDLDSGGANAWSDDGEWRQDFNSDGTADAYNEAYRIDSSGNAEDKIIGIMGVSFLHSDVQTRGLRFNMGRSGNQGVKREFNLESAESSVSQGRAMMLTDVLFDAKEHGTIEFYEDAAQDGNRVVLHGYVAEPVGETLAESSNPLQASNSSRSARGR